MRGNRCVGIAAERVGIARALKRPEEKHFVAKHRPAERRAEAVVVQGGNFIVLGNAAVRVAEEGGGVQGLVLEIVVQLTMELIGAGFGDHRDLCAGCAALPGIVLGRVDAQLLDSFLRGRGQALADRVVD